MSSSRTLTSLWVDETGSPNKALSLSTPTKGEGREDIDRLLREDASGLGALAKQTGILGANGELIISEVKAPGDGTKGGQTYLYITSPTKQILPKNVQPSLGGSSLSRPFVANNIISSAGSLVSNSAAAQRLTMYTPHSGSNTFMSDFNRKRVAESPTLFAMDTDSMDSKRPRKGEKGSKGLRHFSMKVCEKVQRKGITTYNEVADELVSEFTDPKYTLTEQASYDQKNIRRRVYDALNVLMAMNIISKEKKEIRWIGLPTNSVQECQNLENEKMRRLERIEHKTQQLHELVLQQIAYKNLVQRNKEREKSYGPPLDNSSIQLPFIIVNTDKKTVIDCSISNDKYEYLFNFDNTFEIHDDIEVLKRMGLAHGLEKGECSSDDLQKAIDTLPRSLEPYVRQIAATGVSNKSAASASTSASSHSALTAASGTSAAATALRQQSFAASSEISDLMSDESNQSMIALNTNRQSTAYISVGNKM